MYLIREDKEIYAKFENLVSHDSVGKEKYNSDYIKKKIEKQKK